MEHWGLSGLAAWSPTGSPARLMAACAYWFVAQVGLAIGLSALDAQLTSRLVIRLLNFAAVLILVVGWYSRVSRRAGC